MKNSNNDENDPKKSISSAEKNDPERVSKVDHSIDLDLKNLLLDLASDTIWVTDLDGNFIYVNQPAFKTSDYTKKDLMNMNIHELDVPEYAELVDHHLKVLMGTDEDKYETVHYHKDGSQIPVEIHSRIIQINGQKLVLSVVRDIIPLESYPQKLEIEARKYIEKLNKLEQKRKKREKIVLKLSDLKEKLLKSIPLKEKLNLITEGVVEIFDADFARIWLLKNADICEKGCIHANVTEGPHVCKNRSSCLHLVSSSGRFTDINDDHRRIPMGSYKIGRIAAGDDFKFVTNDVAHDPLVHDHERARNLGLVSFSAFKLSSEDGKPIGVLGLFSKEVMDSVSEVLLEDLANTTSQVIITGNIEKALLASENKYRTLIESSTDSIYLLDRNLHYAYLNNQALKMVTKKSEEIIGKGLDAVFPPEVVTGMNTSVSNVFTSGEPFSIEGKYVLPSGARWLNTSLIPIKDDGITNFVLGISRDITEYKLFEIELKEREEHLRFLTDNMIDVIAQIDAKGTLTYVSPSLKVLSGFEPREFIGKTTQDLVHPDDQDMLSTMMKTAIITKKPFDVQYRCLKSDGDFVWVESTAKAIFDTSNNFKSVIFSTRDISRRKEVETALLETEKSLNAFINAITEAEFMLDTEGTILFANDTLCKRVNMSKEEIIGANAYDVLPEDLTKKRREKINRVIESGESLIYSDQRDGIYLNNHIYPIKNENGKVYRLAIVSIDITPLKSAENALKVALKEKELLIKEIHHRVKNNLMVISSLLNLQSRYIKDKEALGLFRESQTRAKSMALIHERLYKSDDLKSINFGEYISNLANDLFRTYGADRNKLELDLRMKNTDNLNVDINTAVPLGLIVNELLSNSIKHAFPDDRGGKIMVDFHKEDDGFILIISDNGIGFPEELDYKNTKSLGLQIVNTLTNQIGGVITMNVQDGTTFTIEFKEDLD